MKIKSTVATLSILSVLSFGAFAADSIDADQAQNRQSLGTVSVGGIIPDGYACGTEQKS
jgi:hypothetical protein